MMGKIRELIMRIKCGKLAFVMAYKNPRIMQQGFIDLMIALFEFLVVSEESSTPMLTKWGIADPNNQGHILLNLWAAKPGANPISRIEELIDERDEAIAAAVHAERRRVWDIMFQARDDAAYYGEYHRAFDVAFCLIFPDGEPKTEYPQT